MRRMFAFLTSLKTAAPIQQPAQYTSIHSASMLGIHTSCFPGTRSACAGVAAGPCRRAPLLSHKHNGWLALAVPSSISSPCRPQFGLSGPTSSRSWCSITPSAAKDRVASPASRAPPKGPLHPDWLEFMRTVYDRGYFQEEHVAKITEDAAIKCPRATKKALQSLARQRSDIVWCLPAAPLAQLTQHGCPHPARNKRKVVASFERVKGYEGVEEARKQLAAEKPPGWMPEAASTLDVLRVLEGWAACHTLKDYPADKIISDCQQLMQLVLELEQQPADPELVALSSQLCATPDVEKFEKLMALETDPNFVSKRQQKLMESMKMKYRKRWIRACEAAGRDAATSKALLQKLMDMVVAKVPVMTGDWLCGQCGALNFNGMSVCSECGVPQSSLGTQTVLQSDLELLEAEGHEVRLGRQAAGGNKSRPWEARGKQGRGAGAPGGGRTAGSPQGRSSMQEWRPPTGAAAAGTSDSSSRSSSSRSPQEQGGSRQQRRPLFERGAEQGGARQPAEGARVRSREGIGRDFDRDDPAESYLAGLSKRSGDRVQRRGQQRSPWQERSSSRAGGGHAE